MTHDMKITCLDGGHSMTCSCGKWFMQENHNDGTTEARMREFRRQHYEHKKLA